MSTWKSLVVIVILAAVLLTGVALVPEAYRLIAFIVACVLFVVGMRLFGTFSTSRTRR